MEKDRGFQSAKKYFKSLLDEEDRLSLIQARERIENLGRAASGVAGQVGLGVLQGVGEAAEATDQLPSNPFSLLKYVDVQTPNQWINKKLRELDPPNSRLEHVANELGHFLPDVVGGLKGARIVRAVTDERNISRSKEILEDLQRQGMKKEIAEGWAKPDPGQGHHSIIPQRVGREYQIPKSIMNSCFNVVHPDGIARYDMSKDHYGLDDHMYGGRLPNNMGRGWSGRKMGFERYGFGKRLWKGTPNCTKYAIGIGGLLGLSGLLEDESD